MSAKIGFLLLTALRLRGCRRCGERAAVPSTDAIYLVEFVPAEGAP